MDNIQKSNIIYRMAIGAIVIVALLYLILGQFLMPYERRTYEYMEFISGWEQILEDSTTNPIEIPYKTMLSAGETLLIKTTLPESMPHSASIIFWNEFDKVEVLIDGKIRLEYDKRGTRIHKSVGPIEYITIDLDSQDAGKEIILNLYAGGNATYVIDKVYLGDELGIWLAIIADNMLSAVIVFCAIILALMCFLVSIYFEKKVTNVVPLKYISLGTLLTAIWVLANSEIHQLIFRNVSVICDIAYIIPSFVGLEFLAYMNLSQKRKYVKLFHFAEQYVLIDCVIYNVLVITGKYYYSEIFLPMITGMILAIAVILGTIFMDIIKKQIKDYMFSALSVSVLCVAGVIQVFLYITKPAAAYTGIVIASALFIMMVVALIGTLRDMLQITRDRDEAIYASKSKGQFLANMSHEIRTPINAVLGMNEIILKSSKEPETLSCAADIQSAGKSLLALVNDILDFSKIESGKMEIIPVNYDISSLLNDCYNLLSARAAEKNLKLEIKNNPDMPYLLFGDEIRIRQIIVNFLTNGIKYTERGTVCLSLDYEKCDEESILLKIAVSDTGKGISEEDQQKLFSSFQRVDEKNNRNIEGTGLGLSITKQLTDLMDGVISVESELGKGSVFRVQIPQSVKSWEKAGTLQMQSSVQLRQMNVHHMKFTAPTARILIVDDMEMNLKVIKGLLKETEIQIDTCTSGKDALVRVCNVAYDVILLDHMMPEMDGIETFRRMKTLPDNQNKSTPVIMLTANAVSGARDEYMAEGFDQYLSKPIESVNLDKMLRKYLSEKICQEVSEAGLQSADSLSQLSFLNVETGMSYCGNMKEIYLEAVETFANSDMRSEIQAYYEAKDWKNYQILVHGLKSSSRTIGATKLSPLAQKLESAAKEEDEATIHNEHGHMMKMYGELIEKICCLGFR